LESATDTLFRIDHFHNSERAAMRLKTGSVLGQFGKAVDGSVSVNFSVSGGSNCAPSCRHHPNSTAPDHLQIGGCYAVAVEKRHDRKQVADKLARHGAMAPHQVIGKATIEYNALIAKGRHVPWVRFSTNGSLPMPQDSNPLFLRQLRTFLEIVISNGSQVHIPVESHEKAEYYRQAIGDLVVIRESLQSTDDVTTQADAVSFVAGDDIRTGANIRERRTAAAKRAARDRKQATGRNTIVCPAVTSGWKKRAGKSETKILCGQCTACSNPQLDVVYPFH
jgi:hypothetical protein